MIGLLTNYGVFFAIIGGFMLMCAGGASDDNEGDDWQEQAWADPGNPASVCYDGDY